MSAQLILFAILTGFICVEGGYFGPVHNHFRRLCPILTLPARFDTGPTIDVFTHWWQYHLDVAGRRLFPNLPQEEHLASAQEHCKVPKDEHDPICAYRDFVALGELIEGDLRRLQTAVDNTVEPSSYFYQYYIDAWFNHPKMFRLDCGRSMKELWTYMGRISRVIAQPEKDLLMRMKTVFDSYHASGLRSELEKSDCSRVSSRNFCTIKLFTEAADKIEKLFEFSGPIMWTETNTIYLKTVQLHFYGVKLKARPEFRVPFLSTTDEEIKTLIRDIVFDIYISLKKGRSQLDRLTNVVTLLPPSHYLPCDKLADFPSLEKVLCTFTGVLFPLKPYIRGLIVEERTGRKLVSTTINYREYLEQKRLEQILGMVETTHYTLLQVAEKLEYEMKKSMGELKSYFQSVADFDMKIAQADAQTIAKRLDKYMRRSRALSSEVDGILHGVLAGAMIAVTGDVYERHALLGMHVVAACNVFGWVFGQSYAQDLMTATQELAQAFAKVAELGGLGMALSDLYREEGNFIEKIRRNERELSSVKRVVSGLGQATPPADFEAAKQTFLQQYENYVPAVTSEDLAGLSTYWTNVISEACRILASTTGAVSALSKGVAGALWLCPKADIKVSRLIAVYEEMVDYQSTMMDSLVQFIRATATYHAANAINADYTLTQPQSIDLQLLSAFSMTCYKISIVSAFNSYCNILEYREGERPVECEGEGTTITSLITRTPRTCRVQDVYVYIPTAPAYTGDNAFIDMKSLYAGDTVEFQIPNSSWLVEHHWIHPERRNDKLFVQRLEVYLPTVSKRKKKVFVRAMASLDQKHEQDGTVYVLSPEKTLEYDYEEGIGHPCRQDTFQNPYDGHCRLLPEICPFSSGIPTSTNAVYPSIYGRWKIQVSGYETAKLSIPSTDISLRAGLKLCIIHRGHVRRRRKGGLQLTYGNGRQPSGLQTEEHDRKARGTDESDERCCGPGQYLLESSQTCTACPVGSVDQYNGLFCGNLTHLVVDSADNLTQVASDTLHEDEIQRAIGHFRGKLLQIIMSPFLDDNTNIPAEFYNESTSEMFLGHMDVRVINELFEGNETEFILDSLQNSSKQFTSYTFKLSSLQLVHEFFGEDDTRHAIQFFNDSDDETTLKAVREKFEQLLLGFLYRRTKQLVMSSLVMVTTDPESTFTFEEAERTCSKLGRDITTPLDMKNSVAHGYDECACGWLSDRSIKAPIPSKSCEANNGASTERCTSDNVVGVYCKNNF